MIVRTWRGATRGVDAKAYLKYLMRTGIPAYEATPGNRGTLLLHRAAGEREEFLILSWWDSLQDIAGFAGDDVATAVFYPEDDRYLVDRDLEAYHWEIGHSSASSPTAGDDLVAGG
jgi:heme-degrading monooxygenase HmoA